MIIQSHVRVTSAIGHKVEGAALEVLEFGHHFGHSGAVTVALYLTFSKPHFPHL